MKYIIILFLFISSIVTAQDLPREISSVPQIVVNNRVFVKLNGKPITLMDVVKKMDMILLREHGNRPIPLQARYQFYTANWQAILNDLIDRELVMQEAEELQVPISSGEIRQELEETFGPNVRLNLENVGLTYDEVYQMMRADTIIRRMLYFQVSSRIYATVTPEVVHRAYDQYSREVKEGQRMAYRIFSLRGQDSDKALEVAKVAHRLLTIEKIAPEKLQAALESQQLLTSAVSLTLSPVFTQSQDAVTESVRKVLSELQIGSYSEPLLQKSRSENIPIVRIYWLQERTNLSPEPFSEMAIKLKEKITNELLAKESDVYFERLRKHFDIKLSDIEAQLPHDFEPFVIQ